MIYEYALDPELIIPWALNQRDYSEFIEAFGIGTTRIPSIVIPFKRWKSLIMQKTSSLDDIQAGMVIDLINAIKEKYIDRQGINGEWYENVIKEHNRFPFDYILVKDKSKCNTKKTIVQDDIYNDIKIKNVDNKKWDHPTQKLVECTTEKMIQVIQNMLGLASHVILIDPYLGAKRNGEQQNPNIIIELIRASLRNNTAKLPVKFEIIYSSVKSKDKEGKPKYRMNPNKDQIQDGISAEDLFYKPEDLYIKLDENPDYLSESIDLSVKDIYEKWKGLRIHNRYILTDIGGVILGKGIEPSYFNHKDEFILLNGDIYRQKWKDYIESINQGGMTPRFGINSQYPPKFTTNKNL